MTASQIALVSRDLLFGSRIAAAAERAGVSLIRVDEPAQLPPAASVSLVLVDWGERQADWADRMNSWRARDPSAAARLILFGPHTDLEAHAAARAVGLGPMWGRGRLAREADGLFAAMGRPVTGGPLPA